MSEHLDGRLPADVCDAMALMVTELVSNAVVHGCASAEDEVAIELRSMDGWLIVCVRDPGLGFGPEPARAEAAGDREGGLGLVLVDELASRWGVEHGPDSTMVWFELAVAGG